MPVPEELREEMESRRADLVERLSEVDDQVTGACFCQLTVVVAVVAGPPPRPSPSQGPSPAPHWALPGPPPSQPMGLSKF